MIRKMLRFAIELILITAAIVFVRAEDQPQSQPQPKPQSIVTDYAHYFSKATVNNLELSYTNFNREHDMDVRLVISPITPEMRVCATANDNDYAKSLQAAWKAQAVVVIFPTGDRPQIAVDAALAEDFDVLSNVNMLAAMVRPEKDIVGDLHPPGPDKIMGAISEARDAFRIHYVMKIASQKKLALKAK